MRTSRFAAAVVLLGLGQVGLAWHGRGHDKATRVAVSALPKEMPAFFAAGADSIAHCSQDPDLFRKPLVAGQVHATERAEHYCDLERLGRKKLPDHRYDLLMWCGENKVQPSAVGFVPYAVTEWTQRLSVAFAEHRAWPDNEHIRQKALVYAGLLAHYAQDLCQPLHTTVHYDGRTKADGSSPRSGIHLKTDALLEKVPAKAKVAVAAKSVQPFAELFPAVVAELSASHALVDKVYELKKLLPAGAEPIKAGGPVAAFTAERLKAAALFTARLYLTAWRDSAKVKIPAWHRRQPRGGRAQARPAGGPASSAK